VGARVLSDDTRGTWARVWDVTMRKNVIRNTAAGVNLLSRAGYSAAPLTNPMRRVALTDNLIVIGGGASGEFGGNLRMFQILQDVNDVTLARNTAIGAYGARGTMTIIFDGTAPAVRVGVADNAFGPTTYGVLGNGTMGITATVAKFAPGATFANNVFTGMSTTGNPANNFYPATLLSAGLGLATTGDYRFLPTGTLATAIGTRQTGANVTALTTLSAAVATP
jgi:hypothetical protein